MSVRSSVPPLSGVTTVLCLLTAMAVSAGSPATPHDPALLVAQAEGTGTPSDDAPDSETACTTNEDCVLVWTCCTCPLEKQALNRLGAERENVRCSVRSCATCELPMPEQPVAARCEAGECVAVYGDGDASPQPFHYDPTSGRCVDEHGNEGLNEAHLPTIVTTGNADCVDLSGRDLLAEGQEPAGMAQFTSVSFRGADLRDTIFPPYGAPSGGDLHGADLRGARDAYCMPLSGFIDEHTRYDATCSVTELGGYRLLECPCVLPSDGVQE